MFYNSLDVFGLRNGKSKVIFPSQKQSRLTLKKTPLYIMTQVPFNPFSNRKNAYIIPEMQLLQQNTDKSTSRFPLEPSEKLTSCERSKIKSRRTVVNNNTSRKWV